MQEHGAILQTIWDRAKAEGVDYIVYRGPLNATESMLGGVFHPDPYGKGTGPQIWLYRQTPPCPSPPNRPQTAGAYVLEDVITLAHEYGHFRSWKDSDDGAKPEWQAYFEAVKARDASPKGLSSEQQRLILDEEERAWTTAESRLRDLGFEGWAAFAARRETGLLNHRIVMGLEKVNPT